MIVNGIVMSLAEYNLACGHATQRLEKNHECAPCSGLKKAEAVILVGIMQDANNLPLMTVHNPFRPHGVNAKNTKHGAPIRDRYSRNLA